MAAFRWDVLGMGAVAVDDLVYVDGHPAADTKAPIVEELREGGGLAGTALVTVARLGGSAAYVGILGDDDLSRFTISELEREGVDCTLVERRSGARPIHSVIIVDRLSGARTLLYSLDGVVPPDPSAITAEVVGRARVLFVDHTVIPAALRAADLARRAGVPVVGDLEDAGADGVRDLASAVDHLIVGTAFAGRLTGATTPPDMVRSLWRPGSAACVVTAGGRGCWYITSGTGDVVHEPARQVSAIDTNGCGDVFHGAYAACIARGESIERAVAVATVAAAGKATTRGGRRGIPDWETVQRLLAGPDPSREYAAGVIGRSESARTTGGLRS